MAITVFQHWPQGGPGRLGMTLRDHGFKLDIRSPHLAADKGGTPVPTDLDNIQGLIILGGPQNVTDIANYPWMQAEAELIRKAHAANLPVIGICLGAQLIAHALGGQVGPREKPAVGFYTMNIPPAGQTETLMAGVAWSSPQALSCGQEIKQLPPGATLLASTANTRNLIFKAGLRTFASVAHFECDRPMLEAMWGASKSDMTAGGVSPQQVEADTEKHYAAYTRLSDRLCVNLANFCFPLRTKLSA